MAIDPQKELAETRLLEDVVVAPIPISNPTVGTGLAVVVMPFYHLVPARRFPTRRWRRATPRAEAGASARRSRRASAATSCAWTAFSATSSCATTSSASARPPAAPASRADRAEGLRLRSRASFPGARNALSSACATAACGETAPDGSPPALLEPLLGPGDHHHELRRWPGGRVRHARQRDEPGFGRALRSTRQLCRRGAGERLQLPYLPPLAAITTAA